MNDETHEILVSLPDLKELQTMIEEALRQVKGLPTEITVVQRLNLFELYKTLRRFIPAMEEVRDD
jgi:hypothetical protein